MTVRHIGWLIMVGISLLGACTHKPPTIAHTHIGHGITGFDGTPGEKGLFVVAEQRGNEVLQAAEQAAAPGRSLAEKQVAIRSLLALTVSEDYGLRKALAEAESHITYAAGSDDASANIRQGAAEFSRNVDIVLKRSDLVALLANDVIGSSDPSEADLLIEQIHKLARENVEGVKASDGSIESPGIIQLRTQLDAMIAAEDPAYQPVDRWYLFHLVRLPNCDNCWAWRKWADSSNRGY